MSTELRMPQLTQTMSEGTLVRWLKREGEAIEKDEPLFEVVTDKAATEVESPAAGVLGKILVPEGEIAVGTPIAILLRPGEALPQIATPVHVEAPAPPVVLAESPVASSPGPVARAGRLRVSPVARRIAMDRGVDLSRVTPSGPGGLIVEADVRRFLEAGTATPTKVASTSETPPAPSMAPRAMPTVTSPPLTLQEGEEAIPLLGVRKTIADRLSLSRRTAADVTTVAEVDMSEISALREHLDFTYTAFVARAVAMALTEFPTLNSRLEGDRIVLSKRIHLGVAVALEDGLKVPVIRDAHTRSLRQIGLELAEKAKLASEGRLSSEDLTGSTFTVTNSGVFGSLLFTPIINPPESAILGMGKIAKMPVVRDDQIVIRKMMYLCLSYDHRVVDGAPAVKFLQRVKTLLETPALLL